jgi:DNA-binding response OmpR family regulator
MIVVASAGDGIADEVAEQLRREGAIAYATHSFGGCLRVATSSGPDVVLLDPALRGRLERLLRAHPATAKAQVLPLTKASVDATRRGLAAHRRPIVAA